MAQNVNPTLGTLRTELARTNKFQWSIMEWLQFFGIVAPPYYINNYFGSAITGIEPIELRGGRAAINNVIGVLDNAADDVTYLRYPNPGTNYVIQSASANDTALGTGARVVQIDYLDAANEAQTAQVTLNGAGQVAIPELAAGLVNAINAVKVVDAGATRTNEGAITITDAALNELIAAIPLGLGQSRSCRYHVPVGKELMIVRFAPECVQAAGGNISFDLIGTVYDADTLATSLPGCLRDLGPYVLVEGQKWEYIFDQAIRVPASTAAIISEITCFVVGNVAGTDIAGASLYGYLVDA